MSPSSAHQLFVNLAVTDLDRSMAFFRELGFDFNLDYCDENAACMVLNEGAYVMLLQRPFFKNFTNNEICDTRTSTEVLLAVSCASRDEVDQMVHTAIEAGGEHALEPSDHGGMYGWSFYDLDGHHWEVMWMDDSSQS